MTIGQKIPSVAKVYTEEEITINKELAKFNARGSLIQALKDTNIDLGKLIAKTALFVSPETAVYLKNNNIFNSILSSSFIIKSQYL
jgi:hypothetical protein